MPLSSASPPPRSLLLWLREAGVRELVATLPATLYGRSALAPTDATPLADPPPAASSASSSSASSSSASSASSSYPVPPAAAAAGERCEEPPPTKASYRQRESPQLFAASATALPDSGAARMEAQSLAAAAGSLDELEKAIKSFNGCALKATATHTVFARGAGDAALMCVGEAPGAEEDRQGLPFVGRSGRLLDAMLAAINLQRDAVRIGNILPWRPPGNRLPSSTEVALCLPFIVRHIELVAPKVLMLMGGLAAQTLLEQKDGITRLRRRWFTFAAPGLAAPVDTKPTFHPAYLLRAPGHKRLAWQDMLAAASRLAAAPKAA